MIIKETHRIPDNILDQLSEWSCGGFVLFNFDEDGNPQVYSKAEDERNAMSLQYLVSHWSEAMEDMNSNSFSKNINEAFLADDEEEGFEEDE
tara:strand:+ start:1312 stop:1587 length:276 start_codon:yes stop_codon:yes gene_type:complete